AAVLDTAPRKNLEALQEGFGLRTVMRLDDAGDDVYAGHALGAGRLEHRVRLADARGGTEEDLQLAARPARLLLSDAKEELVGIGPAIPPAGMSVPPGNPRRGGSIARAATASWARRRAGSARPPRHDWSLFFIIES